VTAVDLIPNVEVAFPGYWSVVGGATSIGVLTDGKSASYIQFNAGGQPLSGPVYELTSVTLGAFQAVAGLRVRAWVLGLTYTPAFGAPAEFRIDAVAGPNFTARLIFEDTVCNSSAAAATPNDCYTQADVPGILRSRWWSHSGTGLQWAQADLDGLRLQIQNLLGGGTALFQVAEMAVEVDVRNAPTVTVNPGLVSSVVPLLTWVSSDADGDAQGLWEVAVFTAAQAAVGGFDPATSPATYRFSGTGPTQSAVLGVNLTVGQTYATYVRVGKVIGLDDNGYRFAPPHLFELWGPWASSSLTVIDTDPIAYRPSVSEAVLDCHDWRVLIAPRGGSSILVELPWREISWSRRLQEVSEAQITFPWADCGPAVLQQVADVRRWVHELQIWRDSIGGDMVEWVGPYAGRSRPNRDDVTFRARDWWSLLERRRLHSTLTAVGVDLATVYAAVANDALAVDNSAGVELAIRATTIIGDRSFSEGEKLRAADLLRELGRNGVDWTMVGRTLLAGGIELPVDALTLLIDEHVLQGNGDETGENDTNDVTIVGKLVDDVQTYGYASVIDERGVLETVVAASDIEDTLAATAFANATLALAQTGADTWKFQLDPRTQVGLASLVPGARWPVNLPSLGLITTLRLAQVDVTITKDDGGVSETIECTLQSLGLEEA